MFLWMVLGLLTIVAVTVVPVPLNMAKKSLLWIKGVKYMIVSKDLPKKFKGTNFVKMDRDLQKSAAGKRVVKLVLVRHGQSVWNSLFNSFGLFWPVRIFKSIFFETLYFFTNPWHSLIIDSPLSAKGVKEAGDLCSYVRASHPKDLPHDTEHSLIVCSNLRRAMATAAIGLGPRLKATGERIFIDSALQEGSRNIDAQSLNTFQQKLISAPVHIWKTALEQSTVFDPEFNWGNKSTKSDVYGRMDTFVKNVFGGSASGGYKPSAGGTNADVTVVVVVGHSGWIRCLFRRFLPETSTHVSKLKKLQTAGAVSVDLVRNEATGEVYLDEATIKPLFRNFA